MIAGDRRQLGVGAESAAARAAPDAVDLVQYAGLEIRELEARRGIRAGVGLHSRRQPATEDDRACEEQEGEGAHRARKRAGGRYSLRPRSARRFVRRVLPTGSYFTSTVIGIRVSLEALHA